MLMPAARLAPLPAGYRVPERERLLEACRLYREIAIFYPTSSLRRAQADGPMIPRHVTPDRLRACRLGGQDIIAHHVCVSAKDDWTSCAAKSSTSAHIADFVQAPNRRASTGDATRFVKLSVC